MERTSLWPRKVWSARSDNVSVAGGAAVSFHGSEYMLEWGSKLTPQQVEDIVEDLKVFQTSSR